MKRTIRLHGDLAREFGEVHHYIVRSAGEAVKALCANFPRFERHLIESEQQQVGYKVLINDEMIIPNPETMHHPVGERGRIDIVPVIGGAKSGFLGIVLGAALIATAIFVPGLGTIGSVLFSFGTSLLLGGVTSLLAPQPKAGSPSEAPENKPSYYFNGPVNTTAQGHPVPLGYGELFIGSAVVSAGITADDYTAMSDFA